MNKIVKFEIAIPEEWYHVLDGIAQRQIRTQNNVVINILYKYLKANDLINDISMTDLINIVHDAEVALSGGSVNVVQPTHVEVKRVEVHRVVESKRKPEESSDEEEQEEDDINLDAVASKLNSIKNEEDNNDDKENEDIEDPFAVEETEESIPEEFIDRLNTYISLESAEEKLQFLEDVGWDQNILNKALEIYDAYEKDPDTWEPYISNIDNGINTIDEVYKHVVEMQEAEDSEDESDSDEFSFIGESKDKDNEKEDDESKEKKGIADEETNEKTEEEPDEDQLLVNLPKADDEENNKKPSISDLIDQTVKKLNNN